VAGSRRLVLHLYIFPYTDRCYVIHHLSDSLRVKDKITTLAELLNTLPNYLILSNARRQLPTIAKDLARLRPAFNRRLSVNRLDDLTA
jgi:hypothetical protein